MDNIVWKLKDFIRIYFIGICYVFDKLLNSFHYSITLNVINDALHLFSQEKRHTIFD